MDVKYKMYIMCINSTSYHINGTTTEGSSHVLFIQKPSKAEICYLQLKQGLINHQLAN